VLARLLNTLTQALQSAGVDLSQANVAVQIDLGKRADRGMISGTSVAKVYI
jgi:sarcosine oxidase gamma subunit